MTDKKNLHRWFKIFFVMVGLFGLVQIIKNYGIDHIIEEAGRSGPALLLLSLTFIPTLLCYATAWLLATNHDKMNNQISFVRKIFIFSRYTAMSISWNNLTPFLKIGGEPIKYMMLKRHMPKADALASTINYNIIHLLATAVSFIICSIVLIVFYPMNSVFIYATGLLAFFFVCILILGFKAMKSTFVTNSKRHHVRAIRLFMVNLQIGMRRLIFFYNKNSKAFVLSLTIDLVARLVEGITFYFGFKMINHPISLLSASLLDVGRTFIDTLFFFIPYQMGSREEGVHFFMEKIMLIDSQGFLTVVLFYRFVEIFWIAVGYTLWVSSRSSVNEPRVKSALFS
ncbi:MAG: lysylphosphatidylglycerol synthase domain-containing protein [Bacteriovorax sp.]|jgi:hypothetical protein